MNIERGLERQITTPAKKAAFSPQRLPLITNVIERWSESIATAIDVDYEPGFANQYVNAIKNNYFPVLVGNHDSQSNAIAIAKLAYIFTGVANDFLPQEKKLKGFLLPLAKSLDTGRQGLWPKIYYEATKPVLEKYNLKPVLTTTNNDYNNRGMDKNSNDFLKAMAQGIGDGYAAIAIFPEGTVEGGRKTQDRKRKGMQPFIDISLETCLMLAKRYKRQQSLIIPVGLEAGYEVHDPQTKRPHKEAVLAGFGIGNLKIAKIHVGLPIKSDGPEIEELIINKTWDEVNNVIGKAVAQLIPEEMRGIYGNRKS